MKYKLLIFVLFMHLYFFETNAQESKNTEQSCSEKLIETLTILAGTNLYQIYLNINMMNENADNLENFELFDNNLYILEKQLNNISDLLGTFNKSKYLTKQDFEYIFQIKEIIFLLQEDIRLFRNYLENADDESFKEFFLNHTKIFKKLNEILELELGPRNK